MEDANKAENLMMNAEYKISSFADSSYAFLVWDSEIQSYINCYLLIRPPYNILIDAGKAQHLPAMLSALGSLNVTPEDVTHIIATHGHPDHIGGCTGFHFAHKQIHKDDTSLLTDAYSAEFSPILFDYGEVLGLKLLLLGQHTPGSIAIFDPHTKALFSGDHICFFGDALPKDGPVSSGNELRLITFKYFHEWMLGPDFLDEENLSLFLKGLANMTTFQAETLCTGHGAILTGEINPFLEKLQEVVSR